ncbi:hypothetical protein C8R45DRAFT_930389 [Mycena sanguinolenta]|nr:hypothetical protein C8R45DRAFT_930389 [Mycena sanguinolenta]
MDRILNGNLGAAASVLQQRTASQPSDPSRRRADFSRGTAFYRSIAHLISGFIHHVARSAASLSDMSMPRMWLRSAGAMVVLIAQATLQIDMWRKARVLREGCGHSSSGTDGGVDWFDVERRERIAAPGRLLDGFPSGVNFAVGQSNVGTDWKYAQLGPSDENVNFTILFDSPELPPANSTATFTIQLAGSSGPTGNKDFSSAAFASFPLAASVNTLTGMRSSCFERSGIGYFTAANTSLPVQAAQRETKVFPRPLSRASRWRRRLIIPRELTLPRALALRWRTSGRSLAAGWSKAQPHGLHEPAMLCRLGLA